jgi:hypothetical protein
VISLRDRHALAAAHRAADDDLFATYEDVRTYRNLLVATCVALFALLILIPLIASEVESDFVTIVVDSTGERSDVTWRDYAAIEFWGAFGGLVGMLVALRRLRTSAGPFGLHAVQATLKVPAGALIALLLVLVLQSGVVDQLQVVDTSQLAAFAALFGFAEEAATRFVDRRANAMLDRADPLSPAD